MTGTTLEYTAAVNLCLFTEKGTSACFSVLFSLFPLLWLISALAAEGFFWCIFDGTPRLPPRGSNLRSICCIQDYLQSKGIRNLPVKVPEVKNKIRKQTVLFCLTALARVSLNLIDDPFSLPRGHSNGRSRDLHRLHRDRWDLACSDLAELIFLTGLVSGLIIKVATAINIERILQRSCLLGQSATPTAVEVEQEKKWLGKRMDRWMEGWKICSETYWVLDVTLIQKHAVIVLI